MAFPTATNPETGENAVLINGEWQKYSATATHTESGHKAYLVNGKWEVEPEPKDDVGFGEALGRSFVGGAERAAAGAATAAGSIKPYIEELEAAAPKPNAARQAQIAANAAKIGGGEDMLLKGADQLRSEAAKTDIQPNENLTGAGVAGEIIGSAAPGVAAAPFGGQEAAVERLKAGGTPEQAAESAAAGTAAAVPQIVAPELGGRAGAALAGRLVSKEAAPLTKTAAKLTGKALGGAATAIPAQMASTAIENAARPDSEQQPILSTGEQAAQALGAGALFGALAHEKAPQKVPADVLRRTITVPDATNQAAAATFAPESATPPPDTKPGDPITPPGAPAAAAVNKDGLPVQTGADVGLVAGVDQDGRTTVHDKAKPDWIWASHTDPETGVQSLKPYNLRESDDYHERVEDAEMQAGKDYYEAHRVATEAQHARDRQLGHDPNEIEAVRKPWNDESAHQARAQGNTTPRVGTEPYRVYDAADMRQDGQAPDNRFILDRDGNRYTDPVHGKLLKQFEVVTAKGDDGTHAVIDANSGKVLASGETREAADLAADQLANAKGTKRLKKALEKEPPLSQQQLRETYKDRYPEARIGAEAVPPQEISNAEENQPPDSAGRDQRPPAGEENPGAQGQGADVEAGQAVRGKADVEPPAAAVAPQIEAAPTPAPEPAAEPPQAAAEAPAAAEPAPAKTKGRGTVLVDPRLDSPFHRRQLEQMAENAGWEQEGGQIIRSGDESDLSYAERANPRYAKGAGEVIGRTSWMPREPWFAGVQRDAGLPGNKKGIATREAVRKAMAGEPLRARQLRHVQALLDEADARHAEDLAFHEEGINPTDDQRQQADLVDHAMSIDENAVERASVQFEDDHEGFLAALRRIVHDDKETADAQATGEDLEAQAGTPRYSLQKPGAGSAENAADRPGAAGFELEGHTTADVAERERAARDAAAAERQRVADEEAKAKADTEAKDFRLTGSKAPADVAMAGGQRALFSLSVDEKKQTETPAFRKWFGGSKVVDEIGEPRVMYHGSTRWDKDGQQLGDIHAFDRLATNKALGRKPGMDTVGSWFSSEPGKEGAGMYTPDTGVMYPVYLSIKNPWRPKNFNQFLDFMHQSEGRDPKKQNPRGAGSTEGLRKELKAMGYDGIRFNRGDLTGAKNKVAAAEARLKRTQEDAYRGGQSKAERAENKVMFANAERNLAAARKYLSEQDAEFEKQDVWVALEPEQIKSAIGNRGTFDTKDPRLAYDIGEPSRTPAVVSKAAEPRTVEDLQRMVSRDMGKSVSIEQVSPRNKADKAMAAAVKRMFGRDVTFIKSDVPGLNGVYVGGKRIFVNPESWKAPSQIAGHELLHSIRDDAPDIYNRLVSALAPGLDTAAWGDFRDELNANRAEKGMRPLPAGKMHEEVVAEVVGDHLADPAFLRQLQKHLEPDLYRRLLAHIADWIDTVRGKITGKPEQMGKQASRFVNNLEAARAAVQEALREVAEREKDRSNARATAPAYSSDAARYSTDGQPRIAGMTRDEFLGNPKITSNRNADLLKPRAYRSVNEAEARPFMDGKYTIKSTPEGAAVFDGDKVIASYNNGDTLTVDKAYRRQGIGQELVYQWRKEHPAPAKTDARTKAAQSIQEKVWDRLSKDAVQ